jgi:hypothetical protein
MTMPLIRFLLVSVFLAVSMEAARAQLIMGARETAMGQAITGLPSTGWSVFNNPAALHNERRSLQFYSIRYYGLSELNDVAVQVSMPVKGFVVGGGVHHFGGSVYSESRFRAGLSGKVAMLQAGAVVNLSSIRYAGPYANSTAVGVDAGVLYNASSSLTLGARAVNLFGGKVRDALADPAREIAAGIAYKPAGDVIFSADYVKDTRYSPSLRFGTELTVMEMLAVRAGMTTEPNTFSAGIGLMLEQLKVNFVMQRHQEGALGLSPGIDIQWRF